MTSVDEPSTPYVHFREKTINLGFGPGPTQTGLYTYRRRLKTLNVRFKKKKKCTIRIAKAKGAVTAPLFSHRRETNSHDAAHI